MTATTLLFSTGPVMTQNRKEVLMEPIKDVLPRVNQAQNET